MVFVMLTGQMNAQIGFRKKGSDLCPQFFLRVVLLTEHAMKRPVQTRRTAG